MSITQTAKTTPRSITSARGFLRGAGGGTVSEKSAGTAIIKHIAGRTARGGTLWALVFGVYVASSVRTFGTYSPSAREKLARSLSGNTGLRALLGPAVRIDHVGPFTAWRVVGTFSLVASIWAVLCATRLLRGEEEKGRWDLLLTGPVSRGQATSRAIAGLVQGWVVLLYISCAISVSGGYQAHPHLSITSSLFLGFAYATAPGMFLAVGTLTSQLASTRRDAAMLAGSILGVSLAFRMLGDVSSGLHWMIWLSPLGWSQELRPFTGSHLMPLIPIGIFTVVLMGASVVVATARDVGAALIPTRDRAEARTRLLHGTTGLATRLRRPVVLGWVVAISLAALLFGLVAQSASQAVSGSATVAKAVSRIGGHEGGAASFLGLIFVLLATLVCLAAAGHVSAIRDEEADGRAENLFAAGAQRSAWLAGNWLVATAATLAVATLAGVFAWLGAASQHTGIGLGRFLAAGINTVPPAMLILGLGALAHGLLPRHASRVVYGFVGWSFLIPLLGTLANLSHWILDTSLLYHVAPAPASDPHWLGGAVLVGMGLAGLVAGGVLFNRRDLVTA